MEAGRDYGCTSAAGTGDTPARTAELLKFEMCHDMGNEQPEITRGSRDQIAPVVPPNGPRPGPFRSVNGRRIRICGMNTFLDNVTAHSLHTIRSKKMSSATIGLVC